MDKSRLPIGVFDSGIGGLTVVKEIIKSLPNESLIYVGDTARVPYGTRDPKTIELFAKELVSFLLKQKVKALVVACNTISAVALPKVLEMAKDIGVINVIDPTVSEALKNVNKSIGVIGTRATINSGVYEKKLKDLNPGILIKAKACPLFVPFVEEGLFWGKALEEIASSYLAELKDTECLILGCTHYPMLRNVIEKTLPNIKVLDSAGPTANALKEYLISEGLENQRGQAKHRFTVTDCAPHTSEIADLIFDNQMPAELEKVELINYRSLRNR